MPLYFITRKKSIRHTLVHRNSWFTQLMGPKNVVESLRKAKKSARLDETKRNNYLIFAEFNLHSNNEHIFDSSHELKATLDHFWMYLRDICYFVQVTVMDWILTPLISGDGKERFHCSVVGFTKYWYLFFFSGRWKVNRSSRLHLTCLFQLIVLISHIFHFDAPSNQRMLRSDGYSFLISLVHIAVVMSKYFVYVLKIVTFDCKGH